MDHIWLKDLFRYEGANCHQLKIKLKYIFFVPGFTYTFFFRKCQNSRFRLLYYVLSRLTSYITHIQIPPTTQIGEGLYISSFRLNYSQSKCQNREKFLY